MKTTKTAPAVNEVSQYSTPQGTRWMVLFTAHEAAARGRAHVKGLSEENAKAFLPGLTVQDCADWAARRAL